MSSLIDIYQSKLKKLNQKIEYNFGTLSKKTEEKLSEINDNLKESQKLLKNLELEVSGESQQSNSYLILKIYKNSYNEYSKKYKVEKEKFENSLKEVSLGINSDINLKQNLKNDEIAYNSFNKLQKATRTSLEMENMTGNILGDLNIQSDKMKNVTVKLGDMNEDLNKSSSLLNGMLKRTKKNKMKILFFAIFLFILFLLILIWKLFIKGNFNNKTPNNNTNNNNNNKINTTSINEAIKI
jgi:hypothetical protein